MTTDQKGLESALDHIRSARKSVKMAIAALEDIHEERLSILAAQHYANLGILYLELEIKLKEEDESAENS